MIVYIAGHTGLLGSALMRHFARRAGVELLTATRAELDLTRPEDVEAWFCRSRPDAVILSAGRVGGIHANAAYPAEFIHENLMIETGIIHGAWKAGVKQLLNFGSSCMYPKACPQPMAIGALMTGPMEPTSEPYAMAKWAGVSMAAAYRRQYGVRFITAIPCTIYGPNDSFDLNGSHVLSAFIRKLHEAKERGDRTVTLWGSGDARREFLYADDAADACEVLLQRYEGEALINVGSGDSTSIRELAMLVADVVGFCGEMLWDHSQPDGAPEKRLETSAIRALGWSPRTSLRDGIRQTYQWFLEAFDMKRNVNVGMPV